MANRSAGKNSPSQVGWKGHDGGTNMPFQYYSRERTNSQEAREQWLPPDQISKYLWAEAAMEVLLCRYGRGVLASLLMVVVSGSHFDPAQAVRVFGHAFVERVGDALTVFVGL
jgi:hypothetical protein